MIKYGKNVVSPFTAISSVQTAQTGVHVQDEQTVRAGLRSIVLRREVDQWVRSFEFVVNSIPVFVKGADVIHFDSFPTRVTLPITAANSSQQRPLTLI